MASNWKSGGPARRRHDRVVVRQGHDTHHICEATPNRVDWGAPPLSAHPESAPQAGALPALLRYLKVDLGTFQLVERAYFAELTRLLRANGANVGDLDANTFAPAVAAWQRAKGLDDDGIPGEGTVWELHRGEAAPLLGTTRVDADLVPGVDGFANFRVRSDVVAAYTAVRRAVLAAGGVLTSAGAIRALDESVGAGRSKTSMHYSGLALDLSTVSGMQDPARDPYVVTRDGAFWRVWCRSSSAPAVSLDAVVWRGHKVTTKTVTVNAFDLTALFEANGFRRIGPRSDFPQKYLSAEWWHFQLATPLVPFLSQFGSELMRVYTVAQVSSSPVWEFRKMLYRRTWS